MPPSAPRRPAARLARWAIGLVVAWAVVTAAIRSEAFSLWAARLLEAAIEDATGEQALIGRVRLAPWERRLTVEGLILSHRDSDPERDGQAIVVLERASIIVGWHAGRPRVALADVVRPVVRLHVDADGLREFRDLPPRPADAPPMEALPWDALRVHQAAVRVEGPGWAVDAEGLDFADPLRGDAGLEIGRLAIEVAGARQVAHGLRLEGLVLAPDAVMIPSMNLRFRPERWRRAPPVDDPRAPEHWVVTELPADAAAPVALSLRGDFGWSAAGGLVADASVEGSLEAWNAALPDSVALAGHLMADVELRGTPGRPALSGAVDVEDSRIFQRFPSGSVRRYEPGHLSLAWRLDGEVLRVEPLLGRWAEGLVEARGAVDLHTLGVRASISGEGLALARVLQTLGAAPHPWVTFEGDVEIQVAGTLSPLALAGSFEVSAADLRVTAGPVENPASEIVLAVPAIVVGGELRMDIHAIRLLAWDLASGGTRGRADATIGFRSYGPLDVRAWFDPVDLSIAAPLSEVGLAGVGTLDAHVWGRFDDLQVEGSADVAAFQVLDVPFADRLRAEIRTTDLVHLELPRFDAVRGQTRYSGSLMLAFEEDFWMDLQILLGRATVQDIASMFVDIPGLTGGVEGTLSIEGDPYFLDGEADLVFHDVNLFGEHFPAGRARANMDLGVFTLDELLLVRDEGAESVLARGTVREGWAANFEVLTSGIALERLDLLPDDLPLRGRAALDLQVGGTLFEPEPRGRLGLRDTWLLGRPVEDSTVAFETSGGVLAFHGLAAGRALALRGTLGLWDQQPYRIDARFDGFPLHAIWPVAMDGGAVEARVTGEATISGRFGDAPTPVEIEARADAVTLAWGTHRLTAPSPWRYTQRGTSFQAENWALSGGATALRFGGWRTADGRTAIAGEGTLDLDLLRMVVPDLERAEGTAEVQLSMMGLPGGPSTPVVEVRASDAAFQGGWFPHPFEDVRATLVASPDGYEVVEASGRLGGGTFEAGGTLDAQGWIPVRYDLHASVRDARVRYLDYLPAMVADAELSFDGPAGALLLSGEIDVNSMVFGERIDWEDWVLELAATRLTGSAEDAWANYFSLDLRLLADHTLRVHNNVGDLSGSADLRVIGDTARPGVVGTVRMDPGGRVFFQEREFELVRGEILFADPYTYDPDLDIALRTEVESREQEYAVDVHVSGPYSDWQTRAGSDPPLPQSDINALLLFGMTQEELERYGGLTTALALQGTDLLAARLGLLEGVGEGPFQWDLFKLDRIELVSGVSERGRGGVSSEVRLLAEKELGWDTALVLEQNLSRTSDAFIGVDKRLARLLYARAFWASEQYGRSLAIGGAYGLEFNLRWEAD